MQAYSGISVFSSTTMNMAETFLTNAVIDLTQQSELKMEYDGKGSRPREWQVDDAPDRFIEMLKKSIVGTSLERQGWGGNLR